VEIPIWLQIILWIAGGLTALGVIWLRAIRPMVRFIYEAERAIPILRSVSDKMSDPDIVEVIIDMARQFQTDSGSSLRDVVNRLEQAAIEARESIDLLRISIESNRQLSAEDRIQIAKLLILIEGLQTKADDAAQTATDVAEDLKNSHDRAAEAGNKPGESADAFSTPPKE